MPVTNERLRGAMVSANVSIQGLADRLGLDVKSVERWLTTERTPHARNAHAAAKILAADPYRLWPSLEVRHRSQPAPRDELVACYPSRGVVPADSWRLLLEGAVGAMDLAVSSMLWLTDAVWDLHTLVADKASAGVRVRVITPAPGAGSATLSDVFPGLEMIPGVRLVEHPALRGDLFRADDDVLVTTPVDGLTPALSPVLHLHRLGTAPLTGGYLTALDHLATTGTPVRTSGLQAVAA